VDRPSGDDLKDQKHLPGLRVQVVIEHRQHRFYLLCVCAWSVICSPRTNSAPFSFFVNFTRNWCPQNGQYVSSRWRVSPSSPGPRSTSSTGTSITSEHLPERLLGGHLHSPHQLGFDRLSQRHQDHNQTPHLLLLAGV